MENNTNNSKEFSFSRYAWGQFKKNKAAYFSFYILVFLFLMALLSPFIANQQPLYVKMHGQKLYPAFSTFWDSGKVDSVWVESTKKHQIIQYDLMDWRTVKVESIVFAPIAYSANTTDPFNRDYVSPTAYQRYKNSEGKIVKIPTRLRHFLGTDKLGRDLAAGIVHGSKISLMVGIFSMFIATLLGIPLGAFAGYYGNDLLKTSRAQFWMGSLGLFLGFFIAFISRSQNISDAFQKGLYIGFIQFMLSVFIMVLGAVIFNYLGKLLRFNRFLKQKVNIPLDSMVSRTIEVLNSLPTLILIITVAAIINERSLTVLMLIIGLTSWTGIARFMRAEILKIKEMEYIQTAKALGYSNRRIIFKHAIPNGLAPVFITVAFGIASAILIESGLSFLGIGVPDDVVTWGNLLSAGREEFEAGWMVIFPGLAIFITVTVYNLIGEGLRDALDPKLKK